jgi:hypothetical protein
VWRASRNFKILINTLWQAPFGTPLLPFLAILGLFGQPWTGRRRAKQLLLVCVLLMTAAALLTTILAHSGRLVWLYVPILLIWAVNGARHLGEWLTATVDPGLKGTRSGERLASAVRFACLLVMFVVAALTIDDYIAGRQSRPTKEAGLWLQSKHAGRITVMDTQSNLAFHAGAEFIFVPNASAERILAYADAKKVDFIVIRPRHPWVVGRKVLEDWGAYGLRHPRAELVYASHGIASQELFIYQWKRPAPDGGELRESSVVEAAVVPEVLPRK